MCCKWAGVYRCTQRAYIWRTYAQFQETGTSAASWETLKGAPLAGRARRPLHGLREGGGAQGVLPGRLQGPECSQTPWTGCGNPRERQRKGVTGKEGVPPELGS